MLMYSADNLHCYNNTSYTAKGIDISFFNIYGWEIIIDQL